MELLFDAAYLITAMTIGILLVRKGGMRFFRMFGIMAIVLASGEAFHLVPRVIALLTTGLEANAFRLGPGKLITSITMTGFYLILYFILEEEYRPDSKQKAVFRISLMRLPRFASSCAPSRKTIGLRWKGRCRSAFCATFRLPSSASKSSGIAK